MKRVQERIFPAYAGVNLGISPRQLTLLYLPRVCGGEPAVCGAPLGAVQTDLPRVCGGEPDLQVLLKIPPLSSPRMRG